MKVKSSKLKVEKEGRGLSSSRLYIIKYLTVEFAFEFKRLFMLKNQQPVCFLFQEIDVGFERFTHVVSAFQSQLV